MSRRPSDKPGLQAERTQLSWERSAFGFLVGGALVLLRQHGPLGVGRTLLTVAAGLLAMLVLWLGHRRAQRTKVVRNVAGKDVVAAPWLEVPLIGYATAAFATAIVVFLIFT